MCLCLCFACRQALVTQTKPCTPLCQVTHIAVWLSLTVHELHFVRICVFVCVSVSIAAWQWYAAVMLMLLYCCVYVTYLLFEGIYDLPFFIIVAVWCCIKCAVVYCTKVIIKVTVIEFNPSLSDHQHPGYQNPPWWEPHQSQFQKAFLLTAWNTVWPRFDYNENIQKYAGMEPCTQRIVETWRKTVGSMLICYNSRGRYSFTLLVIFLPQESVVSSFWDVVVLMFVWSGGSYLDRLNHFDMKHA